MESNYNALPVGLRNTKQRKCVLSILEHASDPMSVLEIYEQIGKEGNLINLSTIYRILNSLTKKGALIRFFVMHNGLAVYEVNRQQHKHYAICMGCQKMFPVSAEHLMPKIDNDFHVLGHNLEIYRYCKQRDRR